MHHPPGIGSEAARRLSAATGSSRWLAASTRLPNLRPRSTRRPHQAGVRKDAWIVATWRGRAQRRAVATLTA